MKARQLKNPARRQKLGAGPRRGVAVVELAVLLPFLLLIVLGISEFGLALRTKSTLSFACRSACSIASKPDSTSEEVEMEAKRLLEAAGLPAHKAVVKVFVNDRLKETSDALRDDRMKVSVSIPIQVVSPFFSGFFRRFINEYSETAVMLKL